jgi:hypothetical protein
MLPDYSASSYMIPAANPCGQCPPCMGMMPAYTCPFAANTGYITAPGYRIPNLPESWSFGPFKIEWSFDGESINLVVKMFEKAIRDLVLTLSKPSVTISTTIGDSTINLKINADFIKNQVSIAGAVCIDTVCTTFNNTVIASW